MSVWKIYLLTTWITYNFIDTFVHFFIFKCDCYTHNATCAWLLFLVSFITSLFTWPGSDMRFHINVGSIWNFNHHSFMSTMPFMSVGIMYIQYEETYERPTWNFVSYQHDISHKNGFQNWQLYNHHALTMNQNIKYKIHYIYKQL